MFNFLMFSGVDWKSSRINVPLEYTRMFEYTGYHIRNQFQQQDGKPRFLKPHLATNHTPEFSLYTSAGRNTTDSPHPQASTWLGFSNTNPDEISPSR